VVTVIVAVPAATAVTVPFCTVTTEVLLLFQDTFLLVALEGNIVAVNVEVFPTLRLKVVLSRLTEVTATVEEPPIIVI